VGEEICGGNEEITIVFLDKTQLSGKRGFGCNNISV